MTFQTSAPGIDVHRGSFLPHTIRDCTGLSESVISSVEFADDFASGESWRHTEPFWIIVFLDERSCLHCAVYSIVLTWLGPPYST